MPSELRCLAIAVAAPATEMAAVVSVQSAPESEMAALVSVQSAPETEMAAWESAPDSGKAAPSLFFSPLPIGHWPVPLAGRLKVCSLH